MERTLWQSPRCVLVLQEDGIYLRVLGRSTVGQLLEEIRPHLPFSSLDLKALLRVTSCGVPLRIAPLPPISSEEPRLELSDDGLFAFLELPPGAWDPHDILDMCTREGIFFGIDTATVREARERAARGEHLSHFPIARGIAPRPGKPGLVVFGTPFPGSSCRRDSCGAVESYALESVFPVRPEQELGRRIPPEPGTPGRSVRGTWIPAPEGIPANPLLGPGVAWRNDLLVSLRQGTLVWHGGTMSVEPLCTVEGDWDSRTPLEEDRHVLITGHLRDGAEVNLQGHLEVRGCIGRARVTSHQGHITALWGVLGKGGAVLRAEEGEIRARYVDEAILEARRVVVNEYLSRSLVQARDGVKVEGRYGLVAASSIRVEAHVRARTIRSTTPGDTRIDIQGIFRPALRTEYRILPHLIRQLHQELIQRAQNIRAGRTPSSEDDHVLAWAHEIEAYSACSNHLEAAQERLLELHDLLSHTRGDATLAVHDTVSSGTELLLKGIAWHPDHICGPLEAFVDSFSQGLAVTKWTA